METSFEAHLIPTYVNQNHFSFIFLIEQILIQSKHKRKCNYNTRGTWKVSRYSPFLWKNLYI